MRVFGTSFWGLTWVPLIRLKPVPTVMVMQELNWEAEDSKAAKEYLEALEQGKVQTIVLEGNIADLLTKA